jgi:hypothetical protein
MDKELAVDDAITGQVVPSLDSLAEAWQEADKAGESATWAKADIALKAVEAYSQGEVRALAAKVGQASQTIYEYRTVAAAWPSSSRPKIPFWLARRFTAQPDRYELATSRKWTVAEARALVRSRKAIPGPKVEPPKPKRDAFLTAVAQIYYSAEYLAEKTAGQPAGISPEEWMESLKRLKAARTMLSRHIQREGKP